MKYWSDILENLDLIFGYILVFNAITFIMVGYDKKRAIKEKWRVPEKKFFIFALLGGALGVYIGMNHFRHKTLHKHFSYGMPLIILLNIVLLYFLISKILPLLPNIFEIF